MHNKDKVILDKKLPYEYNIGLYILEELCGELFIEILNSKCSCKIREKNNSIIDI